VESAYHPWPNGVTEPNDQEAQSMAKYILKKYKEAAKKAGIKRVK